MKWVFLPGLDGAGEFFEPLLKFLPSEIEPLVFAYPARENLDYDELLEWILPQLPENEPFLVVAESFGGPLAVKLTRSEPKGMVGAVVSASFIRSPLPSFLRFGPVESFFRLPFPNAFVRWLLADSDAGSEIFALFDRVIRYSSPEVLADRARSALTVDVTDELKECRLPLLFFDGTCDRLIPRSAMEYVRKLRSDLPVLSVDGPHFLLQLEPEKCLREINRFLDRVLEVKDE